MSADLRRRVYILSAVIVVLYALGLIAVVEELVSGDKLRAGDDLSFFFGTLIFPAVGFLVATRAPRNAVGWILLGIGLAWGVAVATTAYAIYALRINPGGLPGGEYALALSGWGWAPPVGIMGTFLILLFPTGKLLSPRWKIVGWLSAIAVGGTVLAIQFHPGEYSEEGFPNIKNPFYIPALGGFFEVLQFCLPLMGVCFVLSAASLILRYRRSAGVERIQLKWLTAAVGFMASLFAFSILLSAGRSWSTTTPQPAWMDFLDKLGGFSFFLIPISIGIAILRHRLFDIDVVINKALVYGALAAFITAIYVGIVVGIGALVGAGREPNLGLSIAATAVVAVAFQPVRTRVQRFANRLIYGQRLSPYDSITSFSRRMEEALSFDEVLPKMAEAAATGVGGDRSLVKLFLPTGDDIEVQWPPGDNAISFDRTVRVVHQGEEVGLIAVSKRAGEEITRGDQELLEDLASQAGLAMRNLRLTSQLQQRLSELRESRQRIVAAQDEERRRMERDIHDGAQKQLVSLAVKVSLAQNLLEQDQKKSLEILDQLKLETEEIVDSIRTLARGIFPPLLQERGLASAVNSHLQKMGMVGSVDDQIGGARFPAELEAAVYFTIREALQNAAKHAGTSAVSVILSASNGALGFIVRDDGPGFQMDATPPGSGLANMRDRIEAVGGELSIQSSPGRGTVVEGRLRTHTLQPVA